MVRSFSIEAELFVVDLERQRDNARGNQGKKKKLFFLGVDGLLQPRVLFGGDKEKLPGHEGGTMGLEVEGGRLDIKGIRMGVTLALLLA